MTQAITQQDADTIEEIAFKAGELALSHFKMIGSLDVQSKGHLDLVTEADQQVEALVTQALSVAFPEDGVFGEEGASRTGRSGRTWVVDPIDGTFNFVRGGDQWTVSIGLYEGGRPVFGIIRIPVRGQTVMGGIGIPSTLNGTRLPKRTGMNADRAACGIGFHPVIPVDLRMETIRYVISDAKMSFRCCGSATASLIEVAQGQVDGYIGTGDSTWDVMGIVPILEQIGIGSTIDWETTGLSDKLRFACGTAEFLETVEPQVPYGATLSTI